MRFSSCLAILLALVPARAIADVDLTGTWDVTFPTPLPDECVFTFTQAPDGSLSGTLGSCNVGAPGTFTGTIDGASGVFHLDVVAPGDTVCPTYTVDATADAAGQHFSGTYANCPLLPGHTGSVVGARQAICGDGGVQDGEACDAGPLGSECCTAACQTRPAGTSCGPTDACHADTCDGAGTCVTTCSACCDSCMPAPAMTCLRPTLPVAKISFKHAMPATSDKLAWRWSKGDATSTADFGNPATTTPYAFCLYDTGAAPVRLVLGITIPAGGTCGTKPCWRPTGAGFAFADRTASIDGLRALVLKAGGAGKAKMSLRAGGSSLATRYAPGLGELATPVVAQLRTATRCWESRFVMPRRSTSTEFVASGGD